MVKDTASHPKKFKDFQPLLNDLTNKGYLVGLGKSSHKSTGGSLEIEIKSYDSNRNSLMIKASSGSSYHYFYVGLRRYSLTELIDHLKQNYIVKEGVA